MNTNPKAKRILCFGDSNTWGYVPGSKYNRYPINVRWPGVLQKKLGKKFEVIEEGLNGRTTARDSIKKQGKNGATYLFPCLESHYPLDLVILSLGKNDLKTRYAANVTNVAKGIETLSAIIDKEARNKQGKVSKVLLLAPSIIEEHARKDFKGAKVKSKKLSSLYNHVAEKHKWHFYDMAKIITPSTVDGVHIDKNGHKKLASILTEKIRKILAK